MVRGAVALAALLAGGLLCGPPTAVARDYTEGFDGFTSSWTIRANDKEVRARIGRSRHVFHSGTASEQVELQSLVPKSPAELWQKIPECRILPELEVSLHVRSNRDGAKLGVRVVFPYQPKPGTERALTEVITADDTYTRVGSWQRLLLKDLKQKLARELPRLRAKLLQSVASPQEIDLTSPYIDRVVLLVPLTSGPAEFFLDELHVGPIVEFETGAEAPVQQTAGSHDETRGTPDAEFRLDRLHVGGRPYFPRILPLHGESIKEVADSRFNLAWVRDPGDATLLAQLQQHGMRAIATPPRAQGADGQPLDGSEASLAPFGPETEAILLWNLGTQLPAEDVSRIGGWADQVLNADRRYRRLLMADVSGGERSFSRQVPMLGVSRQPLHGSLPFKDYRDALVERRNLAQPGSFFWTWIQTEPTADIDRARFADSTPLVVEPEQLRLQVYAALQAGCRGLGYWTQTSLDANTLGGVERKLTLALLNMELELLEPWLATGVVQGHGQFNVQLPAATSINQLSLGFAMGSQARKRLYHLLSERDIQLRRQAQMARELDAAKIRTDYGLLLLPVWLSEGGQYVPDQMAASNATITVPGVEETASAWELSTTNIRSLDSRKKRVAGGFQLTLDKFDMTSAILFTSDRSFIDRVRKKMETLRQPSALATLELAETKLARVTEVDRQLQELGVGQSDAVRILAAARNFKERARDLYGRTDFDGSRQASCDAMQALRILQHAYWHDAMADLYAPVSSPHAICFQTLPDHWRLMKRYAAVEQLGKPLLDTGDFENGDAVERAGWSQDQASIAGVRSVAEMIDRPHRGRFALRLAAVPGVGDIAPAVITENPVTVRSPVLPVKTGQIVYVSGWVHVTAKTGGNRDGAQLYDSLAGPALALRWTQPTGDWQQFGILREVREDGDFQLTLALTGYGDILFDDLQITVHDPAVESPAAPGPAPTRSNPLQLLQGSLPRFGAKVP